MRSCGRPFFDLNEFPAEETEENNNIPNSEPKKSLPPTDSNASNIFTQIEGPQRMMNNHAFSHASMGSGFQPFICSNNAQSSKECVTEKADGRSPYLASSSSSTLIFKANNISANPSTRNSVTLDAEREEGEWSDEEGVDVPRDDSSCKYDNTGTGESVRKCETPDKNENLTTDKDGSHKLQVPELGNIKDKAGNSSRNGNSSGTLGYESSSRNSDGIAKVDMNAGGLDEPSSIVRSKGVKGVEASHALRFANNPAKRPKIDERKEAMLGKKRARQTVFININEVKQAGPMKSSTPKRQNLSSPLMTRAAKELHRPNSLMANKDQKQTEIINNESLISETNDHKAELNGDSGMGPQERSKMLNNISDSPSEVHMPSIPRQGLWKQPVDVRHCKSPQILSKKPSAIGHSITDQKMGNKKQPSSKKQIVNNSYQDTSVERLLREVTNEKFWHHPEETDLERVPGQFESVEEYVRVLEPLLLEECRAQLYSAWEESTEHIMVRVKHLEKRERGWYDVVVLPPHEMKWPFKEGDVAVLSTPRPGAVRPKRNGGLSLGEFAEPEFSGRVVGTVRRHSPTDTRDLPGAILHFYVGDSYDSSCAVLNAMVAQNHRNIVDDGVVRSKVGDDHILRKFQPRSIWYLTVLGSLATTQREYIALHAFRRLNLQMQTAILKPSPEQFPKYEDRPPAMPECFTQNFVDYLHRTFNGPQLAAIQWAAMHTAAGTSGITKKQDPWPFTLVQGPPGTGKTHTVWGMLNVIHLVQYQHYYAALLKKLAPESYRQTSDSNCESAGIGSIDEVLQSMDENLFRTLPKLCPKPRMLVCAPSNAATDELLARVLNRGFIDGEMKVYRPDVARVGVDSQTRAAQAVSVEQRTNALLEKGHEEVIGWMHNLKVHEAQCSQKIAILQRQLNAAAAVGRSQGSVGVDPDVLVARDQNRDVLLQTLAQVVEQRDKILVEMSRLLIVEGKFRAANFNMEEARASLEASFAREAEIVFTTVSSSGRKLFSRLTHGFDMIVIDEAAQASEVGVLPPLSLGAARCVLVGDPQQLPATVISKAAGTLLYSRSLFERFQQAGCPTMLLSVQYRMHPQIRDFPSRYFYQGRLTDSESVSNLADEIYYKDSLLQPYMFFDIMHGRESHKNGSVSYQNIHEAQFCLRMYEHLQNFLKLNGGNKVSVGIITPYKLQLRCIEREFEQVLKTEVGKDLYINTVDAFQGQERDVIIMSCVRASRHGVGFVADIRRMNVALTRAKRALWVVGNANALIQSEDWAALIQDAKSRKCFMDPNVIPKEFLVLKGSGYNNSRGLRTGGLRHTNLDTFPEPKSGTQSEEDEKLCTSTPKNESYRNSKLQTEKSLDDVGQSSEKSRDSWQHGTANRPKSSGIVRRDV